MPRPKCHAVAAADATAALVAVAALAPAPMAKPMPVCAPPCAVRHPIGMVLNVVVIAGDCGCCFEEHMACGSILEEDIMVHLRKEQIVVPDVLAGKGKVREHLAITVNWVTKGVNCCHVGFLPSNYVEHACVHNGVFCRVIEVFDDKHPNCVTHKKMYKNRGFACIVVISQLNSGK